MARRRPRNRDRSRSSGVKRKGVKWRTVTPVLDVVFYCDADDHAAEQLIAFEWCNDTYGTGNGGPLDSMLPTPVSPTGNLPATGYVCVYDCNQQAYDSAVARIVATGSTVVAHEKTFDQFLADEGLLEIEE